MNRAQLAKRREQAISAVMAGERVSDVAKRFKLTGQYVYWIVRRAGLHVPRSPKGGPRFVARRRAAKVREMVGLGCTYRRMAELLALKYESVFLICKRLGIKAVRDDTGWRPAKDASRSRAETMAALYRDGYTLEQIGQQYGLTRERVRQLMTRHLGLRRDDGGQHVKAERTERFRMAGRNAMSLKRHGCTWAQYVELRDQRKPTRAYSNQKGAAGTRGISWELNLWQWWTIWQQSGHWQERGRGQGYVMCRKGDEGPYAVDNVFIAPAIQNSSDGQRKRRVDPSLPIGVTRTKSGKYQAWRNFNGKGYNLGIHPTPGLAHAAYLRAAQTQGVAA